MNPIAQPGIQELADLLDFLANSPLPEEILALGPSEVMQQRINLLLEKNRAQALTTDEEHEWERYQQLEHSVRIAKANALFIHE